MSISDFSPQLNFLRDSAHSLHLSSPSTAAYLLGTHNQILHEHSKPLNQRQKDTFCGACGTIRDSQSTRDIQVREKGTSRLSSKNISGGRATVYKCPRCSRRTVKPLRKTPILYNPHILTTGTSAVPVVPSSSSTTEAPAAQTPPQLAPEDRGKVSKTAENASSKKRAKARKQGGLQALLASKQQSQPSLDLFDFLQ